MKTNLIFLLLLAANLLLAQANQTTLILLIQNEQQEGIKYETVTIRGEKDKKTQTKRTDQSGKVKFKARKGDTYTISFEDAPNYKVLPISKNSRSITTRRITYKGSKNRPTELKMDTVTQWLKRDVAPTEDLAVYRIVVRDKDGKMIANQDLWLVSKKLKKTYSGRTNREGLVTFLVPKGTAYQLNFPKDPNYKTLTVPNKPYFMKQSGIEYVSDALEFEEMTSGDTVYQKVPETQFATRQRVRVRVFVRNLDDEPLEKEKVFMRSSKGKVYTATTGKDGVTYLMIPKGDYYALSFEYEKGIDSLNYPVGNYLRNDKIKYRYIGSAVIKARARERARQLEIRDSLYRIGEIEWAITDQLKSGIADSVVVNRLENKAKHYKEQLKKEPKYFEKKKEAVLAILHRALNSWKEKIIITDVTCSMYPYIDQVLIWHALKLNVNEKNQYLFFNDGDGKSQAEKILGQTGGIHYTNNKKLEDIVSTMKIAISTGCSGDGPENDLEALIDGGLRKKGLEEIILIADNYSDVRDIELLSQLDVPIRIILAGVDIGVNEHYLEIAYRTGGSVHTLERDIYNLKKMLDGEVITIGKYQYKVLRGKFIRIDRS